MAGIQIKRIKWLRTPTAWETTKAWREHRKAMMAKFQQEADDATSAFTGAWMNKITGTTDLAAQVLTKRVQAEIAAKADAIKKANTVDTVA